MSDKPSSALSTLGKRVERLLYFGTILLLLCCLELYFVSVAVYERSENPSTVIGLIDAVAGERAALEQKRRQRPPVVAKDDPSVAEMRRKLGLPPKIVEPEKREETYGEALRRIVEGASGQISPDTKAIATDTARSPQEIMEALRQRSKQLSEAPVTIWGVTAPPILPMQYGGVTYQLPATFVAKSLLLALSPLFIGWLTSLSITRQREILIMRRNRDFTLGFPHVLNVLPVDWTDAPFPLGRVNRRRRNRAAEQVFLKCFTGAFRTLVLLFFAAPMACILGYCAAILFLTAGADLTTFAIVGLFLLWLFVQTLGLILQEWLLLWSALYYAT